MDGNFDWSKFDDEPKAEGATFTVPARKDQVVIDPRNGMPLVIEEGEGEVKPLSGDEVRSIDDVHLDELLKECVDRKGSDLHLSVGLPPTIRHDGSLASLPYSTLTS